MGLQEMYVLRLTVFGDKGQTWSSPDIVNERVQAGFGMRPRPIVNDDGCLAEGELSVHSTAGMAFAAKNRATLVAGLRLCDRIKVASETGNIGYVAGSYDNEKIGAWA